MPEPRPEAPEPGEQQPDDERREQEPAGEGGQVRLSIVEAERLEGFELGVADRVALACDDLALLHVNPDVPDRSGRSLAGGD